MSKELGRPFESEHEPHPKGTIYCPIVKTVLQISHASSEIFNDTECRSIRCANIHKCREGVR